MNFKEKVRHMSKMGVPSSKIIEEKTPYVAKNLEKKLLIISFSLFLFDREQLPKIHQYLHLIRYLGQYFLNYFLDL